MSNPIPEPPDHLAAPGRRFWSEMHQLFELEAHDVQRLLVCCDSLDNIHRARAILASGQLDRLALSCWRDSAKMFLSSLRAMKVDTADVPTPRGIHGSNS